MTAIRSLKSPKSTAGWRLVGDVMRRVESLSPVAVLHSTRQDAWDIATLNARKLQTPYAGIHRAAVDACFRVMEQGMVPLTGLR